MKTHLLLFLIALATPISNALNTDPHAIIGKWYNKDHTEIVEITKSNKAFVGHIVWMKNPTNKSGDLKLDTKNPNKALQSQSILNSQNIFGLTYNDGEWRNGKIYSHERGGTLDFKIVTVNKTKLIIEISKGFFSKEITFTKAK